MPAAYPLLPFQADRTLTGFGNLVSYKHSHGSGHSSEHSNVHVGPGSHQQAVIDSQGLITWTPTTVEVPKALMLLLRLCWDDGVPPLSAHETAYTVIVQAITSTGPVLATLPQPDCGCEPRCW